MKQEREGRITVWNTEWHWPVKSGKKKEKEEKREKKKDEIK